MDHVIFTQPLLSFIIPVYNGEDYLESCLDSLLKSGLDVSEFEILCIDDCSSDKSREIICLYSSKFKNLRYIFNEYNLKTSSSLNNALHHARGKYIWIIGQDDYIETNSARMLMTICEKENLDVLAFNYNRVDANGSLVAKDVVFNNIVKQSGKQFIKNHFYNSFCVYLLGYEWRAVYNLEFLKKNNINFPENTIYEDTTFMFKAFWKSTNFLSVEDAIYNYRINNSSVTDVSKRYKAGRIFDFFMVSNEVLQYANEIDDVHIKNQLLELSKMYLLSFIYTITPALFVEKRCFYQLVSANWSTIKSNIAELPFYAKILICPKIGLLLTSILKPLFVLKHSFCHKNYSNT